MSFFVSFTSNFCVPCPNVEFICHQENKKYLSIVTKVDSPKIDVFFNSPHVLRVYVPAMKYTPWVHVDGLTTIRESTLCAIGKSGSFEWILVPTI